MTGRLRLLAGIGAGGVVLVAGLVGSCLGLPEGLCGDVEGYRTCPEGEFCRGGRCEAVLAEGEACELDEWCASELCENATCSDGAALDCPPTDASCPCPAETVCSPKSVERLGDFEVIRARGCTHIESLSVRFGDEEAPVPDLRCLREAELLNLDGAAATDLSGFGGLERVGNLRVHGMPVLEGLEGLRLLRAGRIDVVDNEALLSLDALNPGSGGRLTFIGDDQNDGDLVITGNPLLEPVEVCCLVLALREVGWSGVATVDVDCEPWISEEESCEDRGDSGTGSGTGTGTGTGTASASGG